MLQHLRAFHDERLAGPTLGRQPLPAPLANRVDPLMQVEFGTFEFPTWEPGLVLVFAGLEPGAKNSSGIDSSNAAATAPSDLTTDEGSLESSSGKPTDMLRPSA